MIPQKIQALFEFIDYLDRNKKEYVELYIPLCNEIRLLDTRRSQLSPSNNYIDKQQYDELQTQINQKIEPVVQNICIPVFNKLKDLEIWSGDRAYSSIWNNNFSAICDFKENFAAEDVAEVIIYKNKYLSFRKETNNYFLCLQIVLSDLDELFKELFNFFSDSFENEFTSFEAKTIIVNSITDAATGLMESKGQNFRFSIPQESLFDYQNVGQVQPYVNNIKNEFIMGDKLQVGDINNNSGSIIVGKDITVADSLNGRNETADKIAELINLIRKERNANDEQKQSLITNFDKVKEELLEDQPSKSKILKWLTNTKGVLENFVLSHELSQAVDWVYKKLNFIFC